MERGRNVLLVLLFASFHRFPPIGQCNANNSYFLKEHRKNDLKCKKGGNYYLMCWFYMSSILVFTCGRRPTGHGAIPVVVVVGVVVVIVVGGETFF